MINEPIKINNLNSLEREKQRLTIYCSYQEEQMKDKINYIKSNYIQIIGEEFLPFSFEKNKKVSNILDWINEYILSKFLKMDVNGNNNFSGTMIKIAEVVIIRLFNKFVKK